eukprot:SAG11_NODE_487_length_8999_cov_16.256966_9_plen_82_part_00
MIFTSPLADQSAATFGECVMLALLYLVTARRVELELAPKAKNGAAAKPRSGEEAEDDCGTALWKVASVAHALGWCASRWLL